MAFVINADAFQDALNSCLSVRDWEILTGAIQIPENFVPMAYARLAELTVQEFEVSWNIWFSKLKLSSYCKDKRISKTLFKFTTWFLNFLAITTLILGRKF